MFSKDFYFVLDPRLGSPHAWHKVVFAKKMSVHEGEEKGTGGGVYVNPNGMPMTSEGFNLHMDLKKGQIANRIVTVGPANRAEKIAAYLDIEPTPVRYTSGRGFLTITGCFQGTPVSIVAIGIGPAMMDLFVRETRVVVDGPLVICRFGTCGGISADAPPGTVVVASEGSAYVTRNPDAFTHRYIGCVSENKAQKPALSVDVSEAYNFSQLCPSDARLSALVATELSAVLGSGKVVPGSNVTAESFYSSQGRQYEKFEDHNEALVSAVLARYASAKTLEMETFTLLHLARCCNDPVYASAAAIVVASRTSNTTVSEEELGRLEALGGKAVLAAVAALPTHPL